MEKQKKLLVLAGAAPHCFLVETAKEMGLYTIVTDYLPPERSPAKKLADEHWELDIKDVDAIVERCRAEHVDAVINACIDPAQRPYQQICEKLGLPCYGTKEQFYKLTDKRAFKQLCRECGVDVIPDYTLEECRDGTAEYPVFVKPVDSRGSRGQTVCHNFAEVEAAVEIAAAESSNGDFLIERYMEGCSEVGLVFLICGGVPYPVRLTDKINGLAEDGLSRTSIARISPSIFSKRLAAYAEKRLPGFIRRLGIQNAPMMLQGFIDGDTVRLFDPCLRFGGGSFFGNVYQKITDINLMKILIRLSLGQDVSVYGEQLRGTFLQRGRTAIDLQHYLSTGKVASAVGFGEARNHPNVINVYQRIYAGDIVEAFGDIRQCACDIDILPGNDARHIREAIDYAQSTIRFTDAQGNDMHISPLDAETVGKRYSK